MKNFVLCCVMAATASFSVPAYAQKISRQIPVDDSFFPLELSHQGAIAGGWEALTDIIVVGGKLEVCGVQVFTNAQTRSVISSGLRKTTIMMNGKPLIKNLSFFTKVRDKASLAKAPASCRATGIAAPNKIDSLDIKWGYMVFRN